MDTSVDTLRTKAYDAASGVGQMQADAPSLLGQLKQNLVGIFAKDNPVLQARDTALSDYLSTNANTRASLLPTGMPQVEGRPLTLSPTQQNAIVTSRNSAALAPLAGYNEIVKGMYGSIGDIVGGAGDIYNSQIVGAQTNASNLLDLYKTALAEENAKRQAASDQGIFADPALQAILMSVLNPQTSNLQQTGMSLDDIFPLPVSTYGPSNPATQPSPVSPGGYQFSNIGPNISSLTNSIKSALSSTGNFIENNPVTNWLDSLYSNIPTRAK